MIRDIPPEIFIEALDRISRERALTEQESIALEKAINCGRVSHRIAARLGLKRDLTIYTREAETT